MTSSRQKFQDALDHERNMLLQWTEDGAVENGNLPPSDWSVTKQDAFVMGMEYALSLMNGDEDDDFKDGEVILKKQEDGSWKEKADTLRDSVIITVSYSEMNEGYMFEIFDMEREMFNDESESVQGGQCDDGTLAEAIMMACEEAVELC